MKSMKSLKTTALLLALALLLPAAVQASAVQGSIPAAAKRAEADLAKAGRSACSSCKAEEGLARRVLAPGIAEYSFRLRVGPGAHDVIGIHRVVKERSAYTPIRTRDAVLLAHGDAWGFDAAFLAAAASAAAPDDRALPVFLAKNDVDVWGIDFGWTLVPAATTDFGFFEDWGIAKDARHLGAALAVARSLRTLSGSGPGRLHLLGWSRGGLISYVYLNGETRLPRLLRNAAGFIPVDIYLKTNVLDFREAACRRAEAQHALLDAGTFQSGTGTLLATLGQLATAAPGDPSPIVPGLSNRQAGLVAGEATFTFFPPDQQFVPVYHFTGGTFDAASVPTGLLYTNEAFWFNFLAGASPYQPVKLVADSEDLICDEEDVPFDDHLEDIEVPVLYVGAGGGFGEFGVYMTTLLGSTDVETLLVDLRPDADRISDFGHVDLFTAAESETRVWRPILDWIREH